MCTVTFLPGIGSQYILTTSRDEQLSRPVARGPELKKMNDYSLLYPVDPKGGGTWIACDDAGKTVCLFNGAFKAHFPEYPYRHSRGLIVPDFFQYPDAESFSLHYNFSNIEPFTLIIVEHHSLTEFKWDGEKTYLLDHEFSIPKIWSSVTLYTPEIIILRERWFRDWKSGIVHPDQKDILEFHLNAGDGRKETDVQMERKALSLKTVSITSVMVSTNKAKMEYLDLRNHSNQHIELAL